jgi:Protein of unknown function (DUF2490)
MKYQLFVRASAQTLAVLLACATPVHAGADHTAELWLQLIAQGRVGTHARYVLELQPRASSTTGPAVEKMLVRPTVGTQLSDTFSLWLGYGWTPTLSPEFVAEHRVFQQMLFEHPLDDFQLINRTRFEQRVIDNASGPSFRMRHMARVLYRIPGAFGFGLAASE